MYSAQWCFKDQRALKILLKKASGGHIETCMKTSATPPGNKDWSPGITYTYLNTKRFCLCKVTDKVNLLSVCVL